MTQLFKQLNHKPIAYYPVYKQITNSTTGGILLSQLMYWFSKSDKFYKTDEEIKTETLLTKKELENAKKLIKNLPFITVTREGIPAQTYYEIDWEKWVTCITETGNTVSTIGGNCTPQNVETNIVLSLTENTTENTTENKKTTKKDEDFKNIELYKVLIDTEKALYLEYIELRNSLKLKTSYQSHKRLLGKYHDFGRNPSVIENAINANWKDFYSPKQGFINTKEPQVGSIGWRMQQQAAEDKNIIDVEAE
ncbi:MAG TPA: hypothetical protein CFH81_00330 [Sulfurovum sp. UBA12169]|nr:MAG TPA: hypothetical protein CFH81_00330 [Sulfurovum sp. UBA12169]